jgi:SAM-dependent methyltransferase
MICRVLQDQQELVDADAERRSRGLCPPTDARKVWDNLIALQALERVGVEDSVVDIGCRNGILLTWLHQIGYQRLWGCDLKFPLPALERAVLRRHPATLVHGAVMFARNRARMKRASAEATTFQSGIFGAVTSMSVIEHGVDTAFFFRESARLLRPGGILFLSTDYWSRPMRTQGGDRVFGPADVARLAREAEAEGLLPLCKPELEVGSPLIEESGLRYTFLTLAFERPPQPVFE